MEIKLEKNRKFDQNLKLEDGVLYRKNIMNAMDGMKTDLRAKYGLYSPRLRTLLTELFFTLPAPVFRYLTKLTDAQKGLGVRSPDQTDI